MARARHGAVAEMLRDRIVNAVHLGQMRGGERLPSIRTLARELDVNERVVLTALRTLADEGWVELRPRSGAYVAPVHNGHGGPLPQMARWVVEMLLSARARGLAPRHVSEFVRRSLETRRIHAACIECNRDQLHLLCTELSQEHGIIADSAPLDELDPCDPSLTLRRADVLVTTAFHEQKVKAVASALKKPWIAVTLRPDVVRDMGRHLRQGRVYYVATDPRFEPKLKRMLSSVGPVANLQVLLTGRDDLSIIPADAPTFVMPSAVAAVRKRFGERGLGRPIHPQRHLSNESARELLTFIVRANALRGDLA